MITQNIIATVTAKYDSAVAAYTASNVSYQSAKTTETERQKSLSAVRADAARLQKQAETLDGRIAKATEALEAAKTEKSKQTKQKDVERLKQEKAETLAELSAVATHIAKAENAVNVARSALAKAEADKKAKASAAAKAKQAIADAKANADADAEAERLRAKHEAEIEQLRENLKLSKETANKPESEAEKQDAAEELTQTTESDSFIEQMKNGENIAIALNKKFMASFEKMKDQQGMRDLKNIILALVIHDKTGKYATDLQQVKKYIQAYSPFDVRITKRAQDDGSFKHLCRLIQKRDSDHWPKGNDQYWDKISTNKSGGKKAPTLEKVLKQVDELEVGTLESSAKFSAFMEIAKKLGFESLVSYESMEARLIELTNKAA